MSTTSLQRRLRLTHLVATSAGLALASSVYSAAAQATSAAKGLWVVAAIALAGSVSLLASRQFGLLARRYPSAGGIQVYVYHAFGMRLATAVSLLYVLLALAAGAVEAYVFSFVLHYLAVYLQLHWLAAFPAIGWVTLVLAIFFLINLCGVEVAGRVQNWLTYTMFIMFAIFSVAVLVKAGHLGSATGPGFVQPQGFPGLGSLLTAVALSVYLFIGFEWVTPLSEESTDSARMGSAMGMAIILLALSYMLFGAALVCGLPLSDLRNQTVPHLVLGQAQFGWIGLAAMGAVSLLATFTSFNAGMMGNSRLLYAMAREGTLPKFLARIHLRFYTPWAALAAMFLLEWLFTLWLTWTHAYLVPMMLAAAVECSIYVLVSLVVIRMARREPAAWPRAAQCIAWLTAALYAFLAVATLLPPTPVWTPALFVIGLVMCLAYAWIRVPRKGDK